MDDSLFVCRPFLLRPSTHHVPQHFVDSSTSHKFCTNRVLYNYDAGDSWSRLDYFNSILGHPLGPDTEVLCSMVEWTPWQDLNTRWRLSWIRQGETTVSTEFFNHELADEYRTPFPHGIVESILQFQTMATWRFQSAWRLELVLDVLQIHNVQHVSDTDETETRFRVTFYYDGMKGW